jgi:hypothetical protein
MATLICPAPTALPGLFCSARRREVGATLQGKSPLKGHVAHQVRLGNCTLTTPTALPGTNVGSVGNGTMLELSDYLRQTGANELPEDVKAQHPKDIVRGPDIPHDVWADMPVIDLSLLDTDRAETVRQLHEAACEWGFFQVINHGIPLEVLRAAKAEGMKFFELPPEMKAKSEFIKGTRTDGGHLGHYVGDNAKHKASSLFWAESLAFNYEMRDDVWPGGNEAFA